MGGGSIFFQKNDGLSNFFENLTAFVGFQCPLQRKIAKNLGAPFSNQTAHAAHVLRMAPNLIVSHCSGFNIK